MKRRFLFLSVAAAMATLSTQAQTDISLDSEAMYFEIDDLPNAVNWLPAPPEPNSTQFAYDLTQYMWGKGERLNEERAQQAIDNGVVDMEDMTVQFSKPFGMEISKEKTPCIFNVLNRGMLTVRLCARKPKTAITRLRPYVRYQEPTLIPGDEETLRENGSYPSGHAIRGWATALLLCEINPDAQDELLALGYQWGQSRVIAGYHWQSDVDAARLLASAGYARLHTNPDFLADMAAAQAEYAQLTGKSSSVGSAKAAMPRSAAIYNLAGEQLNEEPHTGVYIQNAKKFVK
ncbi:MAG: phosphatase PAP2 family protein [Prevotella sp.]|nr:phosphatase PAP2 family protein [Prevotella sp.]